MGHPVVHLEPMWDQPSRPLHVNVGDTIAFVAPADGIYFHEDGSVYEPERPFVSDPGLMQEALYTDSCADHATCAAWIARLGGTATIYESGPSGIVCDLIPGTTELSCMAIAAAQWSQEIVIDQP